ncbi:hypothetical protein Ahy_B06g081910 [Arachis hypogaea]|uniref:Ubiquitin-like protease family profile domain-containing protein n=1 Tax=Arachis hypogaea TaxID=3818 RepID=A0A444YMA5_ARAHY|nr:hypothetical protein Ahy_B06g081910 [Arachis hypogaea]
MSLTMGDEQVVPNDSQLSEEGNGRVLSTQCPTKAQSATDVGNINVNPELPVNAPLEGVTTTTEGQQGRADIISNVLRSILDAVKRIDARLVTLEANLVELQRLLKVRNSSGVTPLIVTTGTTNVTTSAGNYHSAGLRHPGPDTGTTTTTRCQTDQKIHTYTYLINAANKGKGIIESNSGYMCDVIIPNSPGYDDDVVIDENLSTPPPVVGGQQMGLQTGSMMHWEAGTPKLSLGGNTTRRCPINGQLIRCTHITPNISPCVTVILQAFNNLLGFQQLNCTSVVCELFSHSATPMPPPKIHKVKQAGPISDPPKLPISTIDDTNEIQPELAGKWIALPRQGGSASYKMVFDPTADMDLTYDECHIVAYVYGKTEDLKEVIFKFYELEVTRGMFHSLNPKFVPHSDIVNIVVLFASLRASRESPIHFWFFPSPFAVDVLQLRPIDMIVKKYLCRWMPATTKLEKVIISICEPSHSWYIMVVHVKQGKLYALDITKTEETMERRERNMRTIRSLLILQLGDSNYPKGVSNLPNSNNYAVWCLYWLLNDGLLDPRRLGVMMSGKVRIKTATIIILFDWNQKKQAVDQEAEKLWRTLMRAHD